MTKLSKLCPSPALIVGLAALVMAMSGAAIALPGKGAVKKNDIAKGAVTGKAIASGAVKTKQIARGAVGSRQIKGKSIRGNRIKDKGIKDKQLADGAVGTKQLADDAVTAAKVPDNGLSTAELSDVKAFGTEPVTATDGATPALARAAAPAQQLFEKGPFTVYGKCYRDTTADQVYADIFISTTANGSILDGEGELSGFPAFLNANTPEPDAALEDDTAALANTAVINDGEFAAMAPDGTRLVGQVSSAAKNGTLAAGNGIYGVGNVCLFSGQITG